MATVIIVVFILWLIGADNIVNNFMKVFFSLVFLFFLWFVLTPYNKEYTITERTNIYAVGDVFGASGNVFGISTEGYFFYYEKKGDGYTLGKIDACQYTIYEDEDTSPFFAKYEREHSSVFAKVFGFPITISKYEIHIPRNSVKQVIEFDLKN
jgi:hypothetical protein